MQTSGPRGRVRLAEVAQLAGVHPSTVSRALNADPRLAVRPSTLKRIKEAAAVLGYRPNVLARSLRSSSSDMYGLIIPNFANPIYAQIINGAESGAATLGKHIFATSALHFQSDDSLEVLDDRRIDGLLVAGITAQVDPQLASLRFPWLCLNRLSPTRARHIVLDDEGAAKLAVGHLLALGHGRIGHIAGPPGADTAPRRRAGYVKALSNAGIKWSTSDISVADYTYGGGAEAMRRLASRRRRVTAVFVANVASAIGALWSAQQLGLHVPEDLSIIAIHDLPMASYLIPALTTVRMPLGELGSRGVEILASKPAGAIVAEVVTGPMEVIVRSSTAPIA